MSSTQRDHHRMQSQSYYLKMLAEAIGKLSRNNGAQRKDIWKYCMDNFKERGVDYLIFLQNINELIKVGKLEKNEFGYYWIQKEVYQELYRDCVEGKQSVGSRVTQTDNMNTKGSVTRSVGRLSAVNRRLGQNPLSSANRTYGPGAAVSVPNRKNFYGAQADFPAKKQSRDKFSEQVLRPNSSGKQKSINSGGAKIGKGFKGLSQGLNPFDFNFTNQMTIDQFAIPAPFDQINQNDSQFIHGSYKIGGQDSSQRLGANRQFKNGHDIYQKGGGDIAKNKRNKGQAQSEMPMDFDAPVSLSELPDKNKDPMSEIKARVREEIQMYQQKRKEKKNKRQQQRAQEQQSQIQIQDTVSEMDGWVDNEMGRMMTRSFQAKQQQQTLDNSAQEVSNHNTKLGKRVEASMQQKKNRENIQLQEEKSAKKEDFNLGFRSRSHSQSQISKSENNDGNSANDGNIHILGLHSPNKRDEDSSMFDHNKHSKTVQGPEDLYPSSQTTDKPYKNHKKKGNDNDQELSLQDIEEAENDQKKDEEENVIYDDLNLNSGDEELMRTIQGNFDAQYPGTNYNNNCDQNDNENLSQISCLQANSGVATRRKRRQIEDFEREMSQFSQMSGCSRYSLRPRATRDIPQSKRQEARQSHQMSQGNTLNQNSGSANAAVKKSPIKTSQATKKATEKFNRKLQSNHAKGKEFKSPIAIDKKERTYQKFSHSRLNEDERSQTESGTNLRSSVPGGFGVYNTRNFSHFHNAMSQVVTRNKYSEIISSRPQVDALCGDYLKKSAKGSFAANYASNSGNRSIAGQKRPHPFSNAQKQGHSIERLERSNASQLNKMQRTGLQQHATRRNQSFSAMTSVNTRSRSGNADQGSQLFAMQKQRKQIHQQMALEKVMKQSKFTGGPGPGRTTKMDNQNNQRTPHQSGQASQSQNNKQTAQTARNSQMHHANIPRGKPSDEAQCQKGGDQKNLRKSSVSPSAFNKPNTRHGDQIHQRQPAQVGPQSIQNPTQKLKPTDKREQCSQVSNKAKSYNTNQAQRSQSNQRQEQAQTSQTCTQSGRQTNMPNYQSLHNKGKTGWHEEVAQVASLYGQKVGEQSVASKVGDHPIPPKQRQNPPNQAQLVPQSQSTSISGSDRHSGISLQHLSQKRLPAPPNQNGGAPLRHQYMIQNGHQMIPPYAHNGHQSTHMGNQPILSPLSYNHQERESKLSAMRKINTQTAMRYEGPPQDADQ